ncbi:MAG TPA: glycosyl hydrolase family 18 protein [Bacteroidales bacterium]
MKKQHYVLIISIILTVFIFNSCSKTETIPPDTNTATNVLKSIPANPNNKIAYYVFDCTPVGQGKLPVTTFTANANEVVMFEGTPWEVSDSTHYGSSSSYILTINGGPYKYYKQIINDIHALQATGVKVLWNVDDATSWNTSTPFTTYNGTKLSAAQFAAFVNTSITALGLNGIALDIEHMGSTAGNSYYNTLIQAFGAYFGPKSSNPSNTLYTAAIYDGAAAGNNFGKNTTNAAYLNFVMDMGYFENNSTRFSNWANVIGNGKVMDGMSYDYNSQSTATTWAAWEPSGAKKAGVMVFAGNKNKTYTDAIFAALK